MTGEEGRRIEEKGSAVVNTVEFDFSWDHFPDDVRDELRQEIIEAVVERSPTEQLIREAVRRELRERGDQITVEHQRQQSRVVGDGKGEQRASSGAEALYRSLMGAGVVIAIVASILSLVWGSVVLTVGFVPILGFFAYATRYGFE